MKRDILLCVLCLILAGCSGPKPILYPSDHYRQVGAEVAESDIKACMVLAEEAGASPSQGKTAQAATGTVAGGAIGSAAGAVGGAILGHPGRGAMVGAAGGAVDRCLRERGYDPTGWQ